MPAPDFASEISQLEAALASGELEVEGANGDRVKYRSTAELRQALSYYLSKAAQSAAGPKTRFGVTVAAFDRF